MLSSSGVISYSYTERTTADTLLTRMEALTTIAKRRSLLAREKQSGLTAGIDSGSTTTKAVIMQDDKILGFGWVSSTDVLESAEEAYSIALKESGIERNAVQAIGVTGYGRFMLGKAFNADLVQEEITESLRWAGSVPAHQGASLR